MTPADLWRRYRERAFITPSLDLSLDLSRMAFGDDYLERMEPGMQRAYEAMDALERGAIANPDEGRRVGHYWLRAPHLAPDAETAGAITETLQAVRDFAGAARAGKVRPLRAARFTRLLTIGIGGSALGPMFVADALGTSGADEMEAHFLDNTDPDGFARVFRRLAGKLGETLAVVISKSGATPEPRNAQVHAAAAWKAAGLDFAKHAVAVTGAGSKLDLLARSEGWLARFPMWDWVGGRTSEMSACGLLPAALQGIDIDAMLSGAADCDQATRAHDTRRNPAALLALAWHHATGGRGLKDMVVLPYKDRLLLFSRYLQQLVMESLGKRFDLAGKRVDQGLTVYGNKGSTDQHAYVQQLRDGIDNFFVAFIRVLEAGGETIEVEPGVTAGDYLHGFLLGTRQALFENGRESLTITIRRVDARNIGILIALFERAVGFYATLIGVNAYHQPGVEAGKKAAAALLALEARVEAGLSGALETAEEIAGRIGAPDRAETIYLILEHLEANGRARSDGDVDPGTRRFRA